MRFTLLNGNDCKSQLYNESSSQLTLCHCVVLIRTGKFLLGVWLKSNTRHRVEPKSRTQELPMSKRPKELRSVGRWVSASDSSSSPASCASSFFTSWRTFPSALAVWRLFFISSRMTSLTSAGPVRGLPHLRLQHTLLVPLQIFGCSYEQEFGPWS